MDIEEYSEFALEGEFCPFYKSKELAHTSDIIFMPYNYLLDHRYIENQNFSMENALIIFDEAHNIEKTAEDGIFLIKGYSPEIND